MRTLRRQAVERPAVESLARLGRSHRRDHIDAAPWDIHAVRVGVEGQRYDRNAPGRYAHVRCHALGYRDSERVRSLPAERFPILVVYIRVHAFHRYRVAVAKVAQVYFLLGVAALPVFRGYVVVDIAHTLIHVAQAGVGIRGKGVIAPCAYAGQVPNISVDRIPAPAVLALAGHLPGVVAELPGDVAIHVRALLNRNPLRRRGVAVHALAGEIRRSLHSEHVRARTREQGQRE